MIIVFDLLAAIAAVLLVVMLITQIVIPVLTNRPFFPFFSKETKYKAEAEALRQTLHEQELLEENARLAILASEKANAVNKALKEYAATPKAQTASNTKKPRAQKPKQPVAEVTPNKVDRSTPPVAKPKKPRVRKPKAPTTPAV